MWKAVSETRDHANIRYRVHDLEAGSNYRRHRLLGYVVTILTAVVGTSIFTALAQNNPNFWIQVGTGVLSVVAFVLSAVQSFSGFSELAEKHKKAGNEFLFIQRRADVFLSTYTEAALSDRDKSKANEEQAAILEQFRFVSEASPIRSQAAYEVVNRRLSK